MEEPQQPIQEIIQEEIEEEEREQQYEEDAEAAEDFSDIDPGAVPQPEEQKSVLTFLEGILDGDDRFKTAYLTWEELGKPTFSTRFWINLSNTCDRLFSMPIVASYCLLKARVTTDTSLSREGFIASLAVTQRKIKEKKGMQELAKFMSTKK